MIHHPDSNAIVNYRMGKVVLSLTKSVDASMSKSLVEAPMPYLLAATRIYSSAAHHVKLSAKTSRDTERILLRALFCLQSLYPVP